MINTFTSSEKDMNSRNYAFSYYIHSLILSVIFILFVPIKIILYLKPGDFAEISHSKQPNEP